MIRNLIHALVGVALILVIGWLLGQPAMQKQMAGHPGARYAALGLLAVLALFVLASVVRAFKPKKTPQRQSSYSYTAPAGRK